MATINTVKNMIAAIKHIYPYYAKDIDISYTISLWEMTLSDYDDEITNTAFLKALKTCKQPPTPADVIENITAIYNANLATAEELWSIARQSLPKVRTFLSEFGCRVYGDPIHPQEKIEKVWNTLPYEIKKHFGTVEELKSIARYSEEELRYEKSKFLKNITQIRANQDYQKLFLGEQIKIKSLAE